MASTRDRKRKVINSVQRAIDILNTFDHNAAELGTTEIARALDLNKSTASGLIYTLEVNGYLAQNPETKKYRLGFRLLDRCSILLNQLEIREVAQPHLRKLCTWCDENVNLAVREGAEVIYIERLLGSHTLGMRPRVGKRAAAHSTALGKALLAWLPVEELEQQVAELPLDTMTPNTITDREQLLAELQDTRERGFSIDKEEDQIGGCCVGAPIFDHTGAPVAAISISTPVHRMPPEQLARFGEQVKTVAREISQGLGFTGDKSG